MSVWKAALFFVFCLFITLIINIPVGYLAGRIEIPEQIKISQLSGTLLEGRADTLVVNQLIIQDLEYDFDSACLITLKLCYKFNFADGSGLIQFIPVTGSVVVSQLDLEFSMSNLAGMSDQLLIKPSGSLYLSSDKIILANGQLTDIDAMLIWKNAGIAGENINLGDYQLTISKQNQQYLIFLADKEATLKIDGKGDLKSDGKYSLDININTMSGLEPGVKQALELLATKKGLRQYKIRRSGTSDKRLLSYLSFEDE
jgi:general secretion pathway protein N